MARPAHLEVLAIRANPPPRLMATRSTKAAAYSARVAKNPSSSTHPAAAGKSARSSTHPAAGKRAKPWPRSI
ncbi:hypothetical protein BGY98DRAFT_1050146 [Russula aff. rugulosa BPL654]|nr:hypothetical protein BGY98DRAFT_1050146 [Russula aff. rugulosa BPL654]